MITRRRTLSLAGSALAALAGCIRDEGRSGDDETDTERRATESPATRRTDQPVPEFRETSVSGDLPTWEPARTIDVDYPHVLALDRGDERLFATLSGQDGPSGVAALGPGGEAFEWERSFEGEAVSGTNADSRAYAGTWGVTVADDAIYSVHGREETYEWTAVHALTAATGESRWSFRRERELAVRGTIGETVVVTALEFFEPEHSHDTPEEPLSTAVYGVDAATGEATWSVGFRGVEEVVVVDDAAYVASGRTLTALGPDGAEQWQRDLSAPVESLAAIDGAVVAVTGRDRENATVVGLTPGGEESWSLSLPVGAVAPHGDRAYVLGDVVAAVTADGAVQWREDVHGDDPVLSPDGNSLYTRANVRMDSVDAYSLPAGHRRFRFDTPSNNGWPLAATEDYLVAEAITPEKADFTSLYAVDAADGEPRAVYRPDDTVFAARGFEGTVYVGFGDATLAAFEPGDW